MKGRYNMHKRYDENDPMTLVRVYAKELDGDDGEVASLPQLYALVATTAAATKRTASDKELDYRIAKSNLFNELKEKGKDDPKVKKLTEKEIENLQNTDENLIALKRAYIEAQELADTWSSLETAMRIKKDCLIALSGLQRADTFMQGRSI